ncbi:MAG: sugar ABC transporter permease [Clostridia bacterium]|nr:sugar ABC transporter permease [Clostridia bacterium]
MKLSVKSKRTMNKYMFITAIMAYPMALFLLMYCYVNVNSFLMAFQKTNLDGSSVFIGLDNFKQFFQMIASDGGILNIALINSLKMYVINFVTGVPLSLFFSYLIFKKVPCHKVIRVVIMIPQVVSSMVIALLFKKIMDNALPDLLGDLFYGGKPLLLLYNKSYSFGTTIFYMVWISFGTSCIVYSNAMNEIDNEIMESAQLDGVSNMFVELWHIVIPLIFPTMTTFIVTGFASIFTATGPLVTFYYTNASDHLYNIGYYYTVQIMVGNYSTYNMLAAGGLVMTIIIAPLTNLLRRVLEKYGPGVE